MGFFQKIREGLKEAKAAEEYKYKEEFGENGVELTDEERAQMPVDATAYIESNFESSYVAKREEMRKALKRKVDEKEAASKASEKADKIKTERNKDNGQRIKE